MHGSKVDGMASGEGGGPSASKCSLDVSNSGDCTHVATLVRVAVLDGNVYKIEGGSVVVTK